MHWNKAWREATWSGLSDKPWDLVIIGGGITGAGILREAAHLKLRALLVEAGDFASGTSSRSSKMVHGGLRYLKNMQLNVTLESVREREFLLRQGRGLVNRLGFLYPTLKGDKMPGWMFGAALTIYDLMARQWSHRSYDRDDMRELCPALSTPALTGGYRYFDASTDDARLVLRLLRESVADGGTALNYARAASLLRTRSGRVCGVVIQDMSHRSTEPVEVQAQPVPSLSRDVVETPHPRTQHLPAPREVEVQARVVINATGAWADLLRLSLDQKPRLRPLRGSHFVLPFARLPLTRAVSFLHPRDGRPVFAAPWEGAVTFGTTDIDHRTELVTDPLISSAEAEYLMQALHFVFPAQELEASDVISTFSGLRPVINTGKSDPSKESREHAIWNEKGLLTVSGGKLTTFRIMARQALLAVQKELGGMTSAGPTPVLDPIDPAAEELLASSGLPPARQLRLLARYGPASAALFTSASAEDHRLIDGTPYTFGELRQAARCEAILHLDDLLLRRVRLGLLAPRGGIPLLPQIRAIVQAELGWDDATWEAEAASYSALWHSAYSLKA